MTVVEEDAKDIRPLPYSQPRLEGDKMPEFSTEKELTFTVIYDIFPKVEVKNFSGIAVKEPQVKIGDEEINNELKAIQERNAVEVLASAVLVRPPRVPAEIRV